MQSNESGDEIRVKAGTSAIALADVVVSKVLDRRRSGVELRLSAIAPGAVNQAVKACAIAAKRLLPRGHVLSFTPSIEDGVGREQTVVSRVVLRLSVTAAAPQEEAVPA